MKKSCENCEKIIEDVEHMIMYKDVSDCSNPSEIDGVLAELLDEIKEYKKDCWEEVKK